MTNKQTRRAILAGAAALPTLAIIPVAAIAAGCVDPIFAAIERQKQLWAGWDYTTHPEPPFRSAGYAAWTKWSDAAGRAYNEAFDELLAIKPTTRAGAVALIEYCLSEGARFTNDADDPLALLETLAKALPALA